MADLLNRHGINLALLGAFTWVLYQTAWLCDDAYISYRTVENFVTGHGLTWNPEERVQAFTHPLWLFVNAFFWFFLRTEFITFMGVAMGTSILVTVLFLYRMALSSSQAILGVILFLCSRAFMDYATSGLENPLTNLLLLAFILVFVQVQWDRREIFLLALISGLGVLNRMDSLLLYAPAMTYVLLSQFNLRTIATLALGYTPFILWEIFSLVYYGALVPNTAFAKLGTGIPDGAMAQQGLYYYAHTFFRDPATLPIIALALVLTFIRRDGKTIALALGMVLYMLYIIKIGGGFMGGRFFAAPYFLAVCLLVRMPTFRNSGVAFATAFLAIYISALAPHAPYSTDSTFGDSTEGFKDAYGIGDERRFWYDNGSLTAWASGKAMPAHSYVNTGKGYRSSNQETVRTHGSVGFRGFFAGPKTHIIDYYALTDPLLARLPARYNPKWRIGHFTRMVPKGYEHSLRSDKLQFADDNLNTYYEAIKSVTRGPLWSKERWGHIWNLNRGNYDHLIDTNRYRFARALKKNLADVNKKKTEGLAWNAPGVMVLRNGRQVMHDALWVLLPETLHQSRVEFSGDRNDEYRVLFLNGEDIVGTHQAIPPRNRQAGLATTLAFAPIEAIQAGYDSVLIWPMAGDSKYSLGHVRIPD